MDAVDGKQARRTGSSSPLGQLFDHGCDAVTTTFIVFLALQSSLCAKESDLLGYFFVVIGAHFAFYIGQWEEHFIHQLQTNLGGLLGVTEI